MKTTMLYLLFLIIPAVLCESCTEHYNGMNYTKTAILTIKGLPTNLAYDPNKKDLHFTLIDIASLEDDYVQTKMYQYILRNNTPIRIDNINGQAAAVDALNEKVYIASDDGLYTLDSNDKAQFFSNKDEDIVQLYKPNSSNNLYAVMYPDNDVYIIDVEKNEKRKVKNVPCAFILAVDDAENIYYECDAKYVKMLLKGFEEPIEFVGIPKNNARALVVDSNDMVVLAANDGLYMLHPTNVIPIKLMDLDYVPAGITFDGDDFFVSTNGSIYKYSREECL